VLEQIPDELLTTCGVEFLGFEDAKEIMQQSVREFAEQDYTKELDNFSQAASNI